MLSCLSSVLVCGGLDDWTDQSMSIFKKLPFNPREISLKDARQVYFFLYCKYFFFFFSFIFVFTPGASCSKLG